jgi:hypothetical protein
LENPLSFGFGCGYLTVARGEQFFLELRLLIERHEGRNGTKA